MSTLDKDDVAAIAAAVDALQHHPDDHHRDGAPKLHNRDVKKRLIMVIVVIGTLHVTNRFVHLEAIGRGMEWIIAALFDWWFNIAKEARAAERKVKEEIKEVFKNSGG